MFPAPNIRVAPMRGKANGASKIQTFAGPVKFEHSSTATKPAIRSG